MPQLFNSGILDIILKHSGIAGVVLLFIFLTLRAVIKAPSFTSLSQKRRFKFIQRTLTLIGILGGSFILLGFINILIKRGNHKFYYQGQIINEDKALVRNAMAFLVVGKDTLKSLAPTGNDGNFTIELDTIEGIKGYLHYGHPDYLSNCLFRTISPSTNEQFVLEKKVKPTSNEKKPRTFNLNVIDDVLIREIALKTGLIYVAKKPDFEIKFIVDESLIEKIEDRYRYVGGMVNIMISDRSCGCAKGNISPSHILGFTREMLNDWLNQQIKNIVISTRMDLAEEIAQCLRNQL